MYRKDINDKKIVILMWNCYLTGFRYYRHSVEIIINRKIKINTIRERIN